MITLRCPAKVNLFLAIRGKDSSGYHEIETVFARTTALEDLLHVQEADRFEFHCDTSGIPELPGQLCPPEMNSVVKAIRLLEEKTSRIFHYKITLEKHIPPRSGLGGGSSDAAAILLFLNTHEKIGLTRDELFALGTQVGMDAPFFLSGHDVALGTHYGEKITRLPSLPPSLQISIELTGREVSTPEAYALWDHSAQPSLSLRAAPSLQPLLRALHAQDATGIITALHNDFELISPHISIGKNHLCGSGGALYGFHSL